MLIKKIQNSKGICLEDENIMAREAVDFYHNQFSQATVENDFSLLDHILILVNQEDNQNLNESSIILEVKQSVFLLNGSSASGPDGLTGKFLQST